jgi:hypothetical protein
MAATAWLFDNFPHAMWHGLHTDIQSTAVLKIMLLTAVPAQSAVNKAAVVGDEVASGGGYTTGGATIASKTATLSSHTTSFGWANVTWSASTITAKAAVIYDDTSTDDNLIACVNLNGGANVSSTAGDFTISWTAVSNVTFNTVVATAA